MDFGKIVGASRIRLRGHCKTLWRVRFSIFLALAMVLAAFSNQAAAQSYRFSTIRVDGNQRIETSTIVNYTGITRGKQLTAGELNAAYQRVVASGLFEEVSFDPRGGTLLVHVKEFPTINSISFEGNKRLKDDALGKIIGSASRRVFNPAQAESDASLIASAYAAQGRIAATVTPRIIRRPDNRVDLIYEISEGGTIQVERISFVGNKAYSDRRLRRVLQTKQANFLRAFIKADTLVQDRIQFDRQVLHDFYLSRGYIDFRVLGTNAELTRQRDAYFLVVNVEEGQQYRFGKITTVSDLPDADADAFQKVLRLKSGAVYSPTLVESSISRMERLAIDLGIDFLRVEPVISRNDRDLTLDVQFKLTRGPRVFVERIDIEGNTTTLDRVIRRQFKVAEGDPFNPREIRQAAERIRALGYFKSAETQAREGSTPDKVIVDVNVEEQPTGSFRIGGTFSTNEGFGVALGLSEQNFLGRGQRLAFNVSTATDNKIYTLGFTEPYLLGRDLKFNLDAGLQTSQSSFSNYDVRQILFNPALEFPLSDSSRLQMHYSATSSSMLARTLPASGQSNNGFTIANEIAQGSQVASVIGVKYTYDSRLTGLNPNAGVLLEVGADVGGLGGDSKFLRTRARAIAQTKVLNEEVTLRATLEGGVLSWHGSTPSRTIDRFGQNIRTFRGFEPQGVGPREITKRCVPGSVCDVSAGTGSIYTTDDSLGGNYFASARMEAEFPLGLPDELGIRGSLFYDVGNLWNLSNANTTATGGCTLTTCSQSIVGSGGSLRHVIGFGLLWDTAIGPLRFNFTHALKKETFDKEQSFEFTISTRF